MGIRLKTAPRKKPTQDRSRETIRVLLDTAQEVLIKEGYDRASTNRIAERAGVSIGSVYQYFPNKESLYAGVIDRHCEEQLEFCRSLLICTHERSLETAVRDTVRAIFQAQQINPRLNRAIKEQIPRFGKLKKLDETQGIVAKYVAEELRERKSEISISEFDAAALLIVKTVDAIACGMPSTSESEVILEELIRMVYAYLTSR